VTTLLLTGATGFLGHHVLDYFLKETDYRIVCVIRNISKRLQWVIDSHPEFADRVDLVQELPTLTAIDYIVHCAANAQVGDTLENPLNAVKDNVVLTANILEYAHTSKNLKRFVYISSGEVYGPNTNNNSWTEQDILNCRSPYSGTKAAGEMLVSAWAQSYNIPCAILRAQNIYGARQLPGKFFSLVVRSILQQEIITLHGDHNGNTDQRAWLHVEDCAQAIQFLLDSPLNGFVDTYNLGGDSEQPLLITARYISQLLGQDLKYAVKSANRPGHGARYSVSNKKILAAGFKPKYTGTSGIEQFVQWAQQNTEWLQQ
jgi:dTDP-D-glucose 4,6-dehydratase